MRFLVLSQYYAPEIGAAQIRLRATVRELLSQGHQVEVVTAMPNHPTGTIFAPYKGHFYYREEMDGAVIHRVWVYAALGAGIKRILNYFSFTVLSLYALMKCSRPDYVFVESPPLFLSIPGFIGARWWRAKLIFYVADLWPDSVRDLGLWSNPVILRTAEHLERWAYTVSDFVTAATEGIRGILINKKGVPEHKVLFQPNGVDVDLYRPRPRDEELAQELQLTGKKVVLYAGTHGFAHGIETALVAAEELCVREDIVFLFIGDGSEKTKLVELARDKRLTNVRFMDSKPPEFVARLYTISCIGLSTLRDSPLFEGTRPAKIFASMSTAVPVVYSGAGEGARLVTDADAGLVTPPEDPSALAEAVVRLVDSPQLAQRLGENGRRYVNQHLEWSAIVRDWSSNFNERR